MRARRAVANVAGVMDEVSPGWWDRMRPDELYMRSSALCAMGQVYGTYGAEPRRVREARGFKVATCVAGPWGGASMYSVVAAWSEEVAKRRRAAPDIVERIDSAPLYADATSEAELVGV